MILQTIKQISCLLCLCCFLQQSAFSQDDKDKPAYTLFDNTGKQITNSPNYIVHDPPSDFKSFLAV